MGITDIGIGSEDFNDNELVDFGTSVTHVQATMTENFRGNKTFVFSGTCDKTLVFHKRSKTFIRDKEGERELAPGYIMYKTCDSIDVNTGSGISKGDKIIVGTGTMSEWKVFNPIARPEENPIFYYSDIYLWD